jgi:hypothetical protein
MQNELVHCQLSFGDHSEISEAHSSSTSLRTGHLPFCSRSTDVSRGCAIELASSLQILQFRILMLWQLFSLVLQPNSDLGRLHETSRFTSVTRCRKVSRTPWTGDQIVARPLPVQKHTKTHTQTNTKLPCPAWDWNPLSRRPRERRQFMP